MTYLIIDSGSSATRLYLVKGKKLLASVKRNVGVSETARTGSNAALKDCIRELFEELLVKSGIEEKKIRFAIASGMITSELGLKIVPHMEAPAGLRELLNGIEIVQDTQVFPLPMPLMLIRGVKNRCQTSDFLSLLSADLMRGEEVQAMGVVAHFRNDTLPLNIVELGSTTKLIAIDQDGRINASATSLSGQCFAALIKDTLIGKSVEEEPDCPLPQGYFDHKIVDAAIASVGQSGLLRTLMLTRFSQLLLHTTWYERRLFLSSAIAADDLMLFSNAADHMGIRMQNPFVLIGNPDRCKIYEYMFRQVYSPASIRLITDNREIDNLVIEGIACLVEDHVDELLQKIS